MIDKLQIFKIKDTDGVERNARLIDRIDFNDRNFVFYGIEEADGIEDIYVSYIEQTEDGREKLVDVTDEDDIIWANEFMQEYIKIWESDDE